MFMRNIYGQTLTVLLGVVVGCQSHKNVSGTDSTNAVAATPAKAETVGQTHRVWDKPAFIWLAEYLGDEEANRCDICITGCNFNANNPTPYDCMESIDGGANWNPCLRIIRATSTEYDIVAVHSAAWPGVWVKVRGEDGIYSNPAFVAEYPQAIGDPPISDQISNYTQKR